MTKDLIDEQPADLHIGSEVYVYDENNRVYERDASGRAIGGAIYREFFRKVPIVAETARKWVTHWGEAFKKNPYESGFLTEEMVETRVWEKEHRYKIIRITERVDAETLRKIAEVIGYVP
jgi:hypothetical protein